MLRKTVIITGSAGGIGSATVLKFARAGYNIGLTYNKTSVASLEEEIKTLGVDFYSVKIDISDEKQVIKGLNKLFNHFEYVESVICIAGIAEEERLLIDRNEKDISNIIDVNLKGTIYCNREACKYFMSKKRGNIVNVASILGQTGCSGEVVYSASKAGIIGLTKALSKEMGEFGIRINCVAPGMIKTNMTAGFSEEECKVLQSNTSLRRLGEPNDVADVIYFLASEEARFITGECIEVSGGLLI